MPHRAQPRASAALALALFTTCTQVQANEPPGLATDDAAWVAPVVDCNVAATAAPCVARLLSSRPDLHVRSVRTNASDPGFRPVCIPRRFLELWALEARRESERSCGMPEGALDSIGHYFACSDSSRQGDACRRPELGVALEGGGSKSAPFSLGVLAGLHEAGLLPRVQVISSASGGTYAAYYQFARLMERHKQPRHERTPLSQAWSDWLQDCIPSVYAPLFHAGSGVAHVRYCKELVPAEVDGKGTADAARAVEDPLSSETGNPRRLQPGSAFMQQSPYLHQVRVGQDLLASQQTLGQRSGSAWGADWLGAYVNIAWLTAQHALTLPFHYLAHGLFSWPVGFSPSGQAYRSGIERAYGHSPQSWATALSQENERDALQGDEATRPSRHNRGWRIEDLRAAYLADQRACYDTPSTCEIPLWILSTTSTAGRNLMGWGTKPARDSQRFNFEITPVGHGSGLLGYLNRPPLDMSLRDAVGTSAAFLDPEQRAVGSSVWTRLPVNGALFAINGDWGTRVPNFNAGEHKRAVYAAAPWPLYALPWFQGLRAPYVQLNDGGNTDNLGLFAQLRRGVKTIVVSASTDDRTGEFPSLCKLKNELELEGIADGRSQYTLLVPALSQFAQVCNRQLGDTDEVTWGAEAVTALKAQREAERRAEAMRLPTLARVAHPIGYHLWFWKAPVIEGCVIRRASTTPSDSPNTAAAPESCALAQAQGRVISRLLIIKPALYLPNVMRQMVIGPNGWSVAACQDASTPLHHQVIGNQGMLPTQPAGMDIPCQSLAFLHQDWLNEEKTNLLPGFPQNQFALQTLNSSYTLFGAHFDLARHYASQLTWSDRQPEGPGLAHVVLPEGAIPAISKLIDHQKGSENGRQQ